MSDKPLRDGVVRVLAKIPGARLTLRQICALLNLEIGDTGEPHQNACNMIRVLSRLEAGEVIRSRPPNAEQPDFLYWIEPPP